MALTNSQYDMIMRIYQEKRLSHEKDLKRKLDTAYARFPRLKEIDGEISSLNMKRARIGLGEGAGDTDRLKNSVRDLSDEKKALLQIAGFAKGEPTPDFDCPLCGDTGFTGKAKCSCFKQKEIDLIYSQSGLSEILKEDNFENFDPSLYSENQINPSNNLSARETAVRAYEYAREFVRDFKAKGGNICFSGKTGVGKTFLSHCIAKALMDSGVSVLYLTAFDLFSVFEENAFRTTEETHENSKTVFECDLLIIDDLGTGANNSFFASSLFNCINSRLNSGRSTIISTNLSMAELRDLYSDRLTSRITSRYQRIYLFGDDIRVKKKLGNFSS